MKVYGIATETHETYGHGDFGIERRICAEEAYTGGTKYPPIFKTFEAAKKHLELMKWNYNKSVVELELED